MIRQDEDLADGLAALVALDARLGPIAAQAGVLPLRKGLQAMPGLISVMVAQQVSRASAAAIFERLAGLVDLTDAAAILALDDAQFRQAGLSRAKERTLLAIAAAVITGTLDFERVAQAEVAAALRELTAIPGIGPWTAESYLLFSLGHADVFPAGDLALQIAVADGLGLEGRPSDKALRAIAEFWSPYRSVAARLFWAYYATITRRDAAPAAMAEGFTKPTR
ncbi:DNA-3-methyladenine glycosylase family protein [Aureimonas frigidaquae]|uniref:DNA-3-methyladenine glycosylase II n=1 Tax=Aureimonas frigidaquae TaxID=424757 RepID=A0A0P0Z041_9HYPH|nr:DNA-3-methyladenine glycosylase [Aureimonas frigidaquae]BAT27211.1 base-excision DNA repair protein [Aureimonas frigidaquae]